ncbi:MAG: serpin family protein [Armatimonadetes bacterium]|nr:serpin family protein [Armatimonadota bacterium]
MSINEYSHRLTGAVLNEAKKGDNVVIAPISVYLGTSLMLQGARGQSVQDLNEVLGLGKLRASDSASVIGDLLRDLREAKGASFQFTNALWIQSKYDVKTPSPELEASVFPFAKPDGALVKRVNDWCSLSTKGRIQKLLDKVEDDTNMILTNAITFDGDWESPFQKEWTKKETFKGTRGDSQVDMMLKRSQFEYAQLVDGTQVLNMPYVGNRYAGLFVLPQAGKNPSAVLAKLDTPTWNNWLDRMEPQDLLVRIPKVKLESDLQLDRALVRIGYKPLFKQVDLSGFGRGLEQQQITHAIHKTFLKIDEKGTEAAAATAIRMVSGSPGPRQEPILFTADRPYLFFIYDTKTKLILFSASVQNP